MLPTIPLDEFVRSITDPRLQQEYHAQGIGTKIDALAARDPEVVKYLAEMRERMNEVIKNMSVSQLVKYLVGTKIMKEPSVPLRRCIFELPRIDILVAHLERENIYHMNDAELREYHIISRDRVLLAQEKKVFYRIPEAIDLSSGNRERIVEEILASVYTGPRPIFVRGDVESDEALSSEKLDELNGVYKIGHSILMRVE
jgi:hypothetical protein